ncbi:MAG: hypothetical protein FJW34_22685 [Acidobacteria bacterium]|nr:hypothetical protein [Acidobacteriota bacterium]
MIEPSFLALLVPAIGHAVLAEARLLAAGVAAVALSAITAGTQEEHRAAVAGQAKPLPQNRFPVRGHLSSPAALDNGNGFVAG